MSALDYSYCSKCITVFHATGVRLDAGTPCCGADRTGEPDWPDLIVDDFLSTYDRRMDEFEHYLSRNPGDPWVPWPEHDGSPDEALRTAVIHLALAGEYLWRDTVVLTLQWFDTPAEVVRLLVDRPVEQLEELYGRLTMLEEDQPAPKPGKVLEKEGLSGWNDDWKAVKENRNKLAHGHALAFYDANQRMRRSDGIHAITKADLQHIWRLRQRLIPGFVVLHNHAVRRCFKRAERLGLEPPRLPRRDLMGLVR